MRRSSSLLAAVAVAALAFAPAVADARAGAGSSMGSRGSRTYSAPPTTNTAPSTAAPMERSVTPRPGYAPAPGYAPQPAMSRGGAFTSGLIGGLIGVGLGSMLMGNGLFGGQGFGFMSFMGLLLQLALLFFVGRWLFRMFTSRAQPAMAGGPGLLARQAGGGPVPTSGGAPAQRPVAIGPADYADFDRTLHAIQRAWSAQDMNTLRSLTTPEMAGYFAEQLQTLSRRGLRNTVTDVKLEQGDLAEAWSENGREYATVAMRFSMLDVTRDASGRVVDGDVAVRTMATEVWTFVRTPGGRWLLSAIQQTR